MRLITQKEMNQLLAKFNNLDAKLDKVTEDLTKFKKDTEISLDKITEDLTKFKKDTEISLDKITEDLTKFKKDSEISLVKITCLAELVDTKFNCMSLIVSTLLTILVLGGGTYLVNMNDSQQEDISNIRKELETFRQSK